MNIFSKRAMGLKKRNRESLETHSCDNRAADRLTCTLGSRVCFIFGLVCLLNTDLLSTSRYSTMLMKPEMFYFIWADPSFYWTKLFVFVFGWSTPGIDKISCLRLRAFSECVGKKQRIGNIPSTGSIMNCFPMTWKRRPLQKYDDNRK